MVKFGLRREFCKIIRHILIIEFSPKCTIVPKQQAGIYVSIHLSLEAGLGDNLLASCPILHGQDKRGIRYSILKKVPSEMEVAPRYKLLALLTLLTWFTLFTLVYTGLHS